MPIFRLLITCLALVALLLPLPAAAAQDVLRVAMIPDVNPSRLIRDSQPLVKYLERQTGKRVELVVPTNYAAVVEALVNDQVDFAYLGAFTYVQANRRAGVVPVVQRVEDRNFHSLIIVRPNDGIEQLYDLEGTTFAFGDVNSTSGHLMPSYFLRQLGFDPKRYFSRVVYTGGHDATAFAVANGKVDAGAIDETVYKRLLEKGTIKPSQLKVLYTTPAFTDYVWAARKGLDAATREKLAKAYLSLDPADPEDKKLLALLRGTRFVRADDKSYDKVREAARAVGLLR